MELFFPSAFLALALAHFVALLSPGPDFFLLVATLRATDCAAAPGCASASPRVMRSILFW